MTQADKTRASLLIRIRNSRDREAWSQFVELYAPLVYHMARRAGLQDADASDLTQDVLRSVAGSIGRLDYDPRKGMFRHWLHTVVRNALRNFFQAQRRMPRGSGDPRVQACLEAEPDDDNPDLIWEKEYQTRLLACAADRVRPLFEPTTWQAFWRTAVEGKSGQQVARDLELSTGAVYIARSRVLKRLKEEVRLLEGE